MKVGKTYYKCTDCDDMKTWDKFSLQTEAIENRPLPEDYDIYDAYIKRSYICNLCQQLAEVRYKKNKDKKKKNLLIEQRLGFLYKEPQEEGYNWSVDNKCPVCDTRGNNRCSCYGSSDSDDYTRMYR